MNATQLYKGYSADDKAALKVLQAEEEKRIGEKIPLSDIIAAVEPTLDTPDYLK